MVLDHIGSIFILEVHMMWVFDIQCMGLVIAGDAITGQLGIFIRSFSRCTGIKDSTPPMGLFEHLIHSYIVLILINKHHFGGRPRLQTHPNKTKSNTQFAEFWFRDVMMSWQSWPSWPLPQISRTHSAGAARVVDLAWCRLR